MKRKHKTIPMDDGKHVLAWDKDCTFCRFPDAHKPTKELTYEEIPEVLTPILK